MEIFDIIASLGMPQGLPLLEFLTLLWRAILLAFRRARRAMSSG